MTERRREFNYRLPIRLEVASGVEPLDQVMGAAALDKRFRKLLLDRPHLVFEEEGFDPEFRARIRGISTNDLGEFAREALSARETVEGHRQERGIRPQPLEDFMPRTA